MSKSKSMDFLDDKEKYRLAVFLKRLTFNMAYEVADCGTHEEMKEYAYCTLDVVEKVQKELAAEGFAPR
ncbi:MAG: hypothetical protein LBH44_00390 [Treponema sp.]|jgi:ribose 5-phosphate isomerase RpiB|nr:hypothetical protein [Treponema sp.]